jgi:hypothetical protein
VPGKGGADSCPNIEQNKAGGVVFKPSDVGLTALANPCVSSGVHNITFFVVENSGASRSSLFVGVARPGWAPGNSVAAAATAARAAATLRQWVCVDVNGVAFRNSPSMEDRYGSIRGPDHNVKIKVLREQIGSDGNWLELDVAGHGTKYLPIAKSGTTLFKPIDPVRIDPKGMGEGVSGCWLVQSDGACFENGVKKSSPKDGRVPFETGAFVSLRLNLDEGTMDVCVAHPNVNHGFAGTTTRLCGITGPVTACVHASGQDQKIVQLCSSRSGAGVMAAYRFARELAQRRRGCERLFRCVDPRGVAWRDHSDMQARVAAGLGVELGDVIRVLQAKVGADENWLLCHAPSIGVKFLPLQKPDPAIPRAEQEFLFVEEKCRSGGGDLAVGADDDALAHGGFDDLALLESRIIEVPFAKSLEITLEPKSHLASESARIEVYSVPDDSDAVRHDGLQITIGGRIEGSILLGSPACSSTITVQGSRAEIRVYSDPARIKSNLAKARAKTRETSAGVGDGGGGDGGSDGDSDGEAKTSASLAEAKKPEAMPVLCPKGHSLDFVPVLGIDSWVCAAAAAQSLKDQGEVGESGPAQCVLGCDSSVAGAEISQMLSRYRCHACDWQLCESCHKIAGTRPSALTVASSAGGLAAAVAAAVAAAGASGDGVTTSGHGHSDGCWGWALSLKPEYDDDGLKVVFSNKYKRWRRLTNDVWYPQADAQLVEHCNNIIREKDLGVDDALELWGGGGVGSAPLTWSGRTKKHGAKKTGAVGALPPPPSPSAVVLLTTRWEQSGFAPTTAQLERKPDLAGFCQKRMGSGTIAPAQYRLELIRYFNRVVCKLLPLIDFSHSRSVASLAHRLSRCGPILFQCVKEPLWKRLLTETKGPLGDRSFELVISRPKAQRLRAEVPWKLDTGLRLSCVSQAFRALHNNPSHTLRDLRSHCQLWNTVLAGERSHDVGGPYREVWEEFVIEIMSPCLPLLVPCPNQVNKHGMNRDRFVLNPLSRSSQDIEMFAFFGKLLGMSIRNKLSLRLSLAPLVWKALTNEDPTKADLADVDGFTFTVLDGLLSLSRAEFESTALFWTIKSCAGHLVPLRPGGERERVTWERRNEYVDAAIALRLNETNVQMNAVRRGLATIVPQHLLTVFTWRELEEMVCGAPTMDIELLRNMTSYKSYESSDKTIQYFWEVIASMDPIEQAAFLRFSWGRSRLPLTKSDFGREKFIITKLEHSKPDSRLPIAHTCFFTLDLPAYSSAEALRAKLTYAIFNCVSIDGDNTSEGMAAAARGWDEASGADGDMSDNPAQAWRRH